MHIDVEGKWFTILVGLRDEDAICEVELDWIGLEDGWALRGRQGFKVAMEAEDYIGERLETPGYDEEAYPRRQWEFR